MEEGAGMQAQQDAGTLGCGLEWVLGWQFWDGTSTRMKEHQVQGRYPRMHCRNTWMGGITEHQDVEHQHGEAAGMQENVDAGAPGWKSTRHKPTCTSSVAKCRWNRWCRTQGWAVWGVLLCQSPVSTMWSPAASARCHRLCSEGSKHQIL